MCKEISLNTRWSFLVLLSVFLTGCLQGNSTPEATTMSTTESSSGNINTASFECAGSSVLRKQPYFGDLHIHTKLSFDAYFFNAINGPREAYRYAQGDPGFLPAGDDPNIPVRQIQIDRPLDFAAVTEHAEQLGSFANLCEVQGRLEPGTNPACNVFGQFIRDNVSSFITGNVPIYLQLLNSVGTLTPDTATWNQIQSINNEQYRPCQFTTFNGYEYSSNKGGQVLHRNVIFRSALVPKDVVSSLGFRPSDDNTNDEWNLFDSLKSECLDVDGCDVLTIPHNMNQSDGRFARQRDPISGMPPARDNLTMTMADAKLRNTLDRALEMIQHKGAAECITGFATGLTGEESAGCGFEEWKTLCTGESDQPTECKKVCPGLPTDPLFCQVNDNNGGQPAIHAVKPCVSSEVGASTPTDCTAPLDYAREIIAEGVALSKKYKGVNPYQYGFIASSDTHNGIAGHTEKDQFARQTGHGGVLDDEPNEALGEWQCRAQSLPTDSITGFKVLPDTQDPSDPNNCQGRFFAPVGSNFNPGGLTGVWAHENTREQIFDGIKRRETFATSGSRMRIRLLASNNRPPANVCDLLKAGRSPIEEGLMDGVPMGGELTATAKKPWLVVYAMQDPGGKEPGIPLQRIELIKAWADDKGQRKQQRITLQSNDDAPKPGPQCELSLKGPAQMCQVYQDKDFDPLEGAAYYARAMENESCRWTTRKCVIANAQCSLLDPKTGLFPEASGLAGYEGCCRISGEPGSFSGEFRKITQQERAWSSPVWLNNDQ